MSLHDPFARPAGVRGRVAGWLMALSNRKLNTWAVELLSVRPQDHVLEIGFGPGLAVQELAKRVRQGKVFGVDVSALMVQQAVRRNTATVHAGKVLLHEGGVSQMPFPTASMDKVLAVNSVQFWPHLDADLREVLRVLRPGGRLAIILQPRWAPDTADVLAVRDELLAHLRQTGYTHVRGIVNPLQPMPAIAVLGERAT
jgi:ubiquinone/menaquinone biosynthesis C-methylase UbiE